MLLAPVLRVSDAAKLSGSVHCDITPAAIGTQNLATLDYPRSALGIGIIGVGPLTGIEAQRLASQTALSGDGELSIFLNPEVEAVASTTDTLVLPSVSWP